MGQKENPDKPQVLIYRSFKPIGFFGYLFWPIANPNSRFFIHINQRNNLAEDFGEFLQVNSLAVVKVGEASLP